MTRLLFSWIMLFAFLTIFPVNVEAGEQARYGIKLGMSFGNLSGDFENEFWEGKSRQAVVIGAYAMVKLNEFLCVQPEIMYGSRGAKEAAENSNQSISLTYIDLTALLKISIPTGEKIGPNIFFGPAANMLTGSDYSLGTISADMMDQTTNIDFSAIVGGGLDISSGKGMFIIEGRYMRGFVTIDDRREPGDTFNRSFTIMAGYTF